MNSGGTADFKRNMTNIQKHYYLLFAISCLCFLHSAHCVGDCTHAVRAKRLTSHVAPGGSLSLSCVVKHCGEKWIGDWIWRNSTEVYTIKESERHRLSNTTLSAEETRLYLNILTINQSDEGSYGCSVKWHQGSTDQGHLTYLNVTAAVPSQRIVLHRVFVCAGALLCLPIILGLAWFLSSRVKPQLLPLHEAEYRDQPELSPGLAPLYSQPQKYKPDKQDHSSTSEREPQKKTEVVYADISQDALRQKRAIRQPDQSTVYSSLRFQTEVNEE
ncbi:uncharacterized protein si:dkey-52l18.4 [Cheilinus undulatus]|uniref:uncharacterized protein si:dkey-52l18.4 n=1 Tax=Cheilinus undulatus TaxID=241271 RepID=UPI001BD42E0E|nr:uncharacterized protein si:dkey-52l18.4 [Cheilinus undulatus]